MVVNREAAKVLISERSGTRHARLSRWSAARMGGIWQPCGGRLDQRPFRAAGSPRQPYTFEADCSARAEGAAPAVPGSTAAT